MDATQLQSFSDLLVPLLPNLAFWTLPFALFYICFERFSSLLLQALLPDLSPKEHHQSSSRIVGTIQAIVMCVLAVVAVLDTESTLNNDALFGSSHIARSALRLANGYFAYEMFVTARDGLGWAFYLHSSVGFMSSLLCLRPLLQGPSMAFLIANASTPFLNLRGLLVTAGKTESAVYTVAESGLALTFFVVRVLVYPVMSLRLLYHVLPTIIAGPLPLQVIGGLLVFVLGSLMLLNWFWFSIMVRKAVKRFSAKQK